MYTLQRCAAILFGAALAFSAGAQPAPEDDYSDAPDASYAPAPADASNPPARVARLGYLHGSVSFTPAGEDDWVEAQLNRPIVTGDKLWTDRDARAELQIGSASVTLGHESSFDFLNLDDQLAQMELTQGVLNLDVRRLRGDETFEVDTPTIAFIANRVGDYRIEVDPQGGYTVVTARRGSGDVVGEGGRRVTVDEGQSVRFNDSQLADYQVADIRGPDEFDRFVGERHDRYVRGTSRSYVSEYVAGYEDLDDYGEWDDVPDYGHIWYPREVAVDWAPYHDGHWVWVDPWGWTWVDNAPWGFAPFHYGRWAYVGSRWGWVPGPREVAPIYAPALVAFVGGGGFSLSISSGGPIGWFALGPRDPYFPGYRCGRDYFTRINIGNSYVSRTVINNYYGEWSRGRLDYGRIRYANRTAPRAMFAVQRSAFVSGRPVRTAAVAINDRTFANARVMPRAMVAPTRASLVAGRSGGRAPPAAVVNRRVIAAHQPPAPRPSFAQRQTLIERNRGEPVSVAQMRSLATTRGAAARGANARTAAAAQNVRVVGMRGAATPARTAAAGNRREETGTRAPEMNRSPARANAQYPRSAGFAHEGVVPGSERATNARDRGQAQRNARAGTAGERGREVAGSARERATPNARVPSASFVRGQADARERAAAAREQRSAQQRGATERATQNREMAQERARAAQERRSSARSSSQERAALAQQQRERTQQARADRERATARRQETQRAQSRAAQQRERASAQRQQSDQRERAMAQQRERASAQRRDMQQRERASAQRQEMQQRERASAQRQAVQQRERASAQRQAMQQRERASAQRQEMQQRERASAQRQAMQQRERASAQRQEMQQRERASAQQQAMQQRERAAVQQRQAMQRERAPQRTARQNAPREQPRRDRGKDRDKDKPTGGR